MAEQTGGRVIRQERAARTRAHLLQAAAEVFVEHGFAGATLTKITDRAGVTLGALYFHFRSKGDLAREIVRNQPEHITPPIDSVGLQHAVDVTLTWAHELNHNAVLLAGARLVMEQDAFVDLAENSHQQWSRVMEEDLASARRRRELRSTADVEAIARLIVNSCTGAQMHSLLETGRSDLPERIVDMWRILLPALAAPAAVKRIELDEARGRAR
ncbi:ScbR family autoregulator-binding transcription factor [Streptomyces sp. NPDC051561]|uniref:ScbR family autoregulator-binding transcription factor n=1 Tax=Streptomyces sp. NPDC051561 TaxID=3365658 RepID=UPI0037AEA769